MFGLLDVSDNFKSLNHIIFYKLYFTVVKKNKNNNNYNPQNLVSTQLNKCSKN